MLTPIVRSKSSEQILLILAARGEGYPSEIAGFFDPRLYAIQQKLGKFEDGSVLVSGKVGRTRVYRFNPRYPFLDEPRPLLKRVLEFYPDAIREGLLMNRRRPRKTKRPH